MCEFCEIINKTRSAHMVHESANTMTFLSLDPINEGHVLIIPKLHEASIHKIPIAIITEIMGIAQNIVAAMERIYPMYGYTIMQNGGQCCEYGHFHVHVFPRYDKDGFDWLWPEGTFEYSQRVADQLAVAMNETKEDVMENVIEELEGSK